MRVPALQRHQIRREFNQWQKSPAFKRWLDFAWWNQHGQCYYCHATLYRKQRRTWQVDHKLAIYRGGTNHESNFVLSCPLCNRLKSTEALYRDRDVKRYERKRKARNLYQQGLIRHVVNEVNAELDDQMWSAIERSD